ncbi:MAG: XdhC family protein [Eubacteriales bacterium]|nr:XdhC family protein [Eubacteriales bacterium]
MYRELYELQRKQGRALRAVGISGPCAGKSCIFQEGKARAFVGEEKDFPSFQELFGGAMKTGLVKNGEDVWFTEALFSQPHLVILGAGHVSVPTAKLGKLLGYHVTVMDDREEFANRERFPEVDEVILGDFEEIPDRIPPYENTYYVIVTRGHMGDSLCARKLLNRPYAYMGMIGSRSKAALAKKALLEEGFSQEQVDSIHSPIGLPIGGQLPEEIGVSILAEIVQEKNRHYADYCDQAVADRILEGAKGVMVTIVGKEGSSPRGVGSKMLVEEDGRTTGSVGGGRVEYEAICRCAQVREWALEKYKLYTGKEAANLGMVCGGTVELLFERI